MPTNLSSTGATFPTQTAPAAGEARTSSSVATPFQNAADRAEYLKRRLDILQTDDEGVRRIRTVASVADLQAVTDHPNGTVIEVAGVGLYRFDDASSLAELSPLVIKPTDVGAGVGRWIVHGYGMINVANGIAGLDTNGKLATARLAGANVNGKFDGPSIARGLIDQSFLNLSGGSFSVAADTTWRDVTGCQITTSADVLIGDTLSASFLVTINPASSDKAYLRLRVVKPDTSTADYDEGLWVGQAGANPEGPQVPIVKHIPASLSGVHILKLQAKGTSGNSGTFNVTRFNGRVDVHRA